MLKIITSLFITGIVLGYGPCFLSCGPLLVPYIAATKENAKGGFKTYVLFSATRLFVYAAFGIAAGVLGEWVLRHFLESTFLRVVFIVFGIFLIVCGFLLMFDRFAIGQKCPASIRKYLAPGSAKNVIIFGLIVSLSPCMPLTAVLGYIALISDSWYRGILYMLAFGLGTVISPMIVLSIFAGQIAKIFNKHLLVMRVIRIICGLVMILLGLSLCLPAEGR